METVNVQLDESGTSVVSVFAGPQDPEVFPRQVAIPLDDPRYVAYKSALPESMQRALP